MRSTSCSATRFAASRRFGLTEPLEARRRVVGIEASQRVVSTSQNGIGYRRDKVWRFEKQLKGEGPPGVLRDMAQVLSFFTPRKRFSLEWTVFGFLDRPWKVNVKASVPITVSMPKGPKKPKRSKSPRRRAIG